MSAMQIDRPNHSSKQRPTNHKAKVHLTRWAWMLSVLTTTALTTTMAWSDEPINENQQTQQVSSENRLRFMQQGNTQFVMPPNQTAPRLGFMGHMKFGWGMMVDYVNFGTTAQRVGLESGDVIVRVNGQRVQSARHWNYLMWQAVQRYGGRVSLKVDNVRARQGHPVPPHAFVTGWLDQGYYKVAPRSANGGGVQTHQSTQTSSM